MHPSQPTDPEVRAIVRNLYECAEAILMRQIDHLITTRTLYHGGNFMYLADRAFFFGTMAHFVKVLETHNSRTHSFCWLYDRNRITVDAFAEGRNYDMNWLWCLAKRARDVRNKTLFHIDRHGLLDPRAIWRQANISGADVGRALGIVWHCLQHLHRVKTGDYHSGIIALDREPTEQILDHAVEVIEKNDASVEGLSPTNLIPDIQSSWET
jgi:hypothetical protein